MTSQLLKSYLYVGLLCAAIAMSSCKRLPDGVLDEKRMVALLVDIHKGEGLADMERSNFQNDSVKKLLKQSIYLKHGVTAAEVDSSFVWYGKNLADYMIIYDKVVEELESELKEDKAKGNMAPVFAEGDSVDIWNAAPSYRIDYRLPVGNIVFNIENDANSKMGDNYTIQYKMLNKRDGGMKVKSALFVKYDDGMVEYRTNETGAEGWSRLKIVSDSTKNIDRIYGYLSFDPSQGEVVFLDSVGLVRTRLASRNYHERGNLKRIYPPIENVQTDSVAGNPDDENNAQGPLSVESGVSLRSQAKADIAK